MRPVVVEIAPVSSTWSHSDTPVGSSSLVNEITDYLLLLFSIEASDVESHHNDFLKLLQYFVVSPLLVLSSGSLLRCSLLFPCSNPSTLPRSLLCCWGCQCSNSFLPLVLLWFRCSQCSNSSLLLDFALLWYPHVSILLFFHHSRRSIVSLVHFSGYVAFAISSILLMGWNRSYRLLLSLGFRGIWGFF